MTYSEIVSRLMENQGDIEQVSIVSDKAMKRLKDVDPVFYEDVMYELEEMYYCIDEDDAVEIVRRMRDRGEVWSISTIKNYLAEKGITTDIVKWYLVMNMVANDYQHTADQFISGDKTDFYFSLAKDFVTDVDGKPFKVEKYFKE